MPLPRQRLQLLYPHIAHPQLLGLGIMITAFGLLGGRPRLWEGAGPTILFGSTTALVLIGLALSGFAVGRNLLQRLPLNTVASSRTFSRAPWIAFGGAIGYVGLFSSDWLTRPHAFFKGPFCRPEAVVLGLVVWYVARWGASVQRRAVLLLPILSALGVLTCFLLYADGRTVISDDHAVFLYRLQLLKEEFPRIPFYYPLWNGGIDARDFFASGSLNVFFLFYPIIWAWDLWHSYTIIVGLALFIVRPIAMGAAARVLGLSRPSAALAATLSLGSSLLWYRWGLKYGTMGYVVSTSLAPLCWALWFRVAQRRFPLSWQLWISTFLVTTLVSFWSLAPIAMGPIVLAFVFDGWQGIFRRRLLALGGVLLAVNIPWILLFLSVSRVTSFLGAEQPTAIHASTTSDSPPSENASAPAFRHRSSGISLSNGVTQLRQWAGQLNPLLCVFGPIGLLLLRRRLGIIFAIQCAWLLLIGTLLVSLKPQLELDRMLVVLASFLCIPTAVALRFLMRCRAMPLKRPTRLIDTWAHHTARGGILFAFASTVLTPLYACFVVQNRTLEHYTFASPSYEQIIAAVRRYAGDGRALFSGQVVHELDEGHLAPLTTLTHHPMIASSQVHNLWTYKQVVPPDFLAQGDDGIERYFDLMNVSLVFAHDPKWRAWLQQHPERYARVLEGPPFAAFVRKQESPSYFLEGTGTILSQATHGVTFTPGTAEGVIKFVWFPFLHATPSCSLSPYPVGKELTFIRYQGCTPGIPVTVRAGPPLERLFPETNNGE